MINGNALGIGHWLPANSSGATYNTSNNGIWASPEQANGPLSNSYDSNRPYFSSASNNNCPLPNYPLPSSVVSPFAKHFDTSSIDSSSLWANQAAPPPMASADSTAIGVNGSQTTTPASYFGSCERSAWYAPTAPVYRSAALPSPAIGFGSAAGELLTMTSSKPSSSLWATGNEAAADVLTPDAYHQLAALVNAAGAMSSAPSDATTLFNGNQSSNLYHSPSQSPPRSNGSMAVGSDAACSTIGGGNELGCSDAVPHSQSPYNRMVRLCIQCV